MIDNNFINSFMSVAIPYAAHMHSNGVFNDDFSILHLAQLVRNNWAMQRLFKAAAVSKLCTSCMYK
jgi:hypothetical protein